MDAFDLRVVSHRFQSPIVLLDLLVDVYAGLAHSSWHPLGCKA
jgi:hypothetical protein